MFKWLKTKISNLYNRYKAWKKRHPVLTYSVSTGVACWCIVYAVTTLAVAATEPMLLPLGVFFFVAVVLYRDLYTFMWRRTGRFLDETYVPKMEVVA